MKKEFELELTMFDAGAADSGAPGGTAPDSGDAAVAQPQTTADDTQQNLPDKNAEFEKLIKGEFKEQYEQRIKENMNRRFKESSYLRSRLAQNDEIMNMLKTRYGIENGDYTKIAEALRNDNTYINEEAEKSGMDPESFKKLRELEYENASMKRAMQAQKEDMHMRNTVRGWLADSEELLKSHPDFDLEREAANPAFVRLLRGGADLKTAYYALHHKEIVDSMVEKTREETLRRTTDNIRARGSRPVENGLSQKSTAIVKTDVSKLTPAERAEIARRVASGEEISF